MTIHGYEISIIIKAIIETIIIYSIPAIVSVIILAFITKITGCKNWLTKLIEIK